MKINACVASGGWASMGQGAGPWTPKAEEHPQAYQPPTQPRAPSNDDGNIKENGKKQ